VVVQRLRIQRKSAIRRRTLTTGESFLLETAQLGTRQIIQSKKKDFRSCQ
jgi:hypothetical protein